MEEVRKVLEQELMELEKIEEAAEKDWKTAPQGTLRITKNHNMEQYYWRQDPQNTTGKYIRKSEEKLVRSLAQKDYAQKVLSVLKPIIAHKKKEFQKNQSVDGKEQVRVIYENLSKARQKLIVPYVYPEEKFVEIWEQKQEHKKEKIREMGHFSEANTEIYTEKGECVRSKSEKILADKLYMMKIPYSYEIPLYLRGYGYIKPDFIVLNKRNGKEYYWEHLGMMDDKEYCEKAIKKIETLERNNIFPGKNMILTYETKEHPLNIKIVERLIEEYLL